MIRAIRPDGPRPALTLLALALLAGCEGTSEGQVPVHPVRGKVTFKGKPLADALVVLEPEAGGQPDVPRPTGRTDAEGLFQLHTYTGTDGAPAGSYRVGITVAPSAEASFDPFKNAAEKTRIAVPKGPGRRYADPASSGLKADIRAGDNDLPPFDLN